MSVNFKPRITWKERMNELICPYEWYGIQKPTGLSPFHVREPKFVSMDELGKLVRGGTAHNTPRGLSMVQGLTDNDFQVKFTDPQAQWRALPGPDGKPATRGPVNFQFQGGDVILELTLGLYLVDSVEPGDDEKSRKIYNLFYEHELLHVMDEVDIVQQWLPQQAKQDPTVAKYFVQAEPYTYGLQSQTAEQARADFLQFVTRPIFNLWAGESNRREKIRDAQAEYDKISDQYYKLVYGKSTR